MPLLSVAGLAFAVTALVIPVLARLSEKIGLVDLPNERKIHDRPIPLVGGLAVYCGVVAALLLGGLADGLVRQLLLASFGVLALGVLDDRLDLRFSYRLIAQIGIAAALCSVGVRFHLIGIDAIDQILTILWIVGAINAFNCLDCADGMAGSSALVAFIGFATTASWNGRDFVTQLAVAGAGAVAGFLLFNRPKARVFLGDTGSTLLGLMVATLSIVSSPKPGEALQIPWPAVALLVPLYDLILVHARRYQAGIRSIRHLLASTGKDHLPHRLLARGLGAWGSLLGVALLSSLSASAGWYLNVGAWPAGVLLLTLLGCLLWQLEKAPATAFTREKARSVKVEHTEKPWGYEVLWARTERYAGKMLYIRAGERISLQHHKRKDETLFLLDGECELELEVEGAPRRLHWRMAQDEAYRVRAGQRHRLTALTDTRVLEASTPELEDVVRWEDDYGRTPVPQERSEVPRPSVA